LNGFFFAIFSSKSQTDINGWTVNLGATRRTASPFFVRKRKVSRLLKHPGFNPSANMYSSDIALILLEESVDFDEFLRPICLPESSLIRILPGIQSLELIEITLELMNNS
jgi:hypothetical protein